MALNLNILEKYRNKVFIKNSVYHGDEIQLALMAGFEKVCAGEKSYNDFLIAHRRKYVKFEYQDLWISNQDSVQTIKYYLNVLHKSTIGIDCSYYSRHGIKKGSFPVLEELQVIADNPIKTHTIIIDDIILFPKFGIEIEGLKEFIRSEINKDYKFELEDGYIQKNVLVTYI